MHFVLIRLGIPQSALAFYIYRPGKSYPFSKSDYTKIPQIKQLLLGLELGRPDQSDRSAFDLPDLAVNICPLLFGEFHKPKSKN